MEYGFTKNDVLLIYGHFMDDINKLEAICNAANVTPSMKAEAQISIKLYASITDKIRTKHPGADLLAR